jgi:hypothetical protein
MQILPYSLGKSNSASRLRSSGEPFPSSDAKRIELASHAPLAPSEALITRILGRLSRNGSTGVSVPR